jgi:hypothetical protein
VLAHPRGRSLAVFMDRSPYAAHIFSSFNDFLLRRMAGDDENNTEIAVIHRSLTSKI